MTRSAVLAAFLLAAVIGCGKSNRLEVAGRVTLDGQPVDGGTINFMPADGKAGPAAWSQLHGGQYSIPAKTGPAVGVNRVEIYWPRKTGRKRPTTPPMPALDEYLEAIPARYNSKSELTTELKPGRNQTDFALKSK
jgi:hypothetical protein